MTKFLKVGESGFGRFLDGARTPSEAPSLKECAERAGGGGDGSTLLFSHPKAAGHNYELRETVDPLGNRTMNLFSKRSGGTAINPGGSQTIDSARADREAETAKLKSINAQSRAYYGKSNPDRAA